MMRVLVVDDISFVRKSLKQILTTLGYDVVGEATNGLEVIEQYQLLKPDLVTMDLSMPKLNGIEATRKIISIDPAATIIIMTALLQEHLASEALVAGAKNYIIKPFASFEVEKVLKEASDHIRKDPITLYA